MKGSTSPTTRGSQVGRVGAQLLLPTTLCAAVLMPVALVG
jgi:hypothetical protein